ncbi:MAG: hypothetical protein M5U11_08815 [Anaerolineales bacterium]|jgi:hypothetical protein|nr:hypothetical protein [Anaerolineales bacterium]MDX9938256.1 hypothetical protein [Anaerolineales bacterium]OQY84802.1 MAG: hypothetical protein B6D40_04835 [Anaerolineae bacterium UTCFX3]GER81274.1 conserved hypothetical protein [Candidatus Denitrolinea symbiosum]
MKSRAVQITRIFFYILAALWLAAGIGYVSRSDGRLLFYVTAAVMFLGVFVFILLGMNIAKKPAYWTGAALLAICIPLTIFDEFGLADLVALTAFVIPLVVMLVKRKEFQLETP